MIGLMKIMAPSTITSTIMIKATATIKKSGDSQGRETTTGEDFRQGPTPEHPNLLQST